VWSAIRGKFGLTQAWDPIGNDVAEEHVLGCGQLPSRDGVAERTETFAGTGRDVVPARVCAQSRPAGLEQIVRWYLSAHHRDNPGDGCPNAALLDEIGRCADATRQAYTDGVLVVIDGLAARMAPEDPPSARVKALSLLGLMAGTLQLSRALTDRQLSDDLLEQGLRNALALLSAEQHI
jgi:hypothetical protein